MLEFTEGAAAVTPSDPLRRERKPRRRERGRLTGVALGQARLGDLIDYQCGRLVPSLGRDLLSGRSHEHGACHQEDDGTYHVLAKAGR